MIDNEKASIDLDLLKKLYVVDGLSGRECATVIGCAKSTALKWIKKMGLSRPNNQHKDKHGRFIKEKQKLPSPYVEDQENWNGDVKCGTYRRIAFRHHPHHCFYCKKSEGILHVHHRDENRKNNKPDNLRIVCPKCHMHIEHPENIKRERDTLGRFK